MIQDTPTNDFRFKECLTNNTLKLKPAQIDTLQINITKLCNQACRHCHVDASPKRKETMSKETIDKCLIVLKDNPQIINLDITGGAPELNPNFDYLVVQAKELEKHIIVRHNLTVTFDGHPHTSESKEYLPQFFAENKVEVISSLPCYQEKSTDQQRGKGVFNKSIQAIKQLNDLGYGVEGSGLIINLVYNPVGAYLPAAQADLELQYKNELQQKYGLVFNKLYTITNMPIHRFKKQLIELEQYDNYMNKLLSSFNPKAAEAVMCRNMVSVGYDGRLYDCDFNQMLGMNIKETPSLENFSLEKLEQREILFADHCFGCTAGGGSSCGGATA